MNQDEAIIGRLKIVGIFALLAVVGLFKGCTDVRFAVGGEKAEATFMKFSSIPQSRGRQSSTQYVRYRFADADGADCIGFDTVSLDWRPPADGKLEIVYLPGKMHIDNRNTVSRLQESSGIMGILMLLIGLVGTAISGYSAFRYMERARPG